MVPGKYLLNLFDDIMNVPIGPADPRIRFPRVKDLIIINNQVFPAATIFHAFPNLEEINVTMNLFDASDERSFLSPDEILQDHLSSRAELVRVNPKRPHLKSIKGEARDLFRSAFLCTTKHLSSE